jgi:hypothetical protein
MRQWNTSYQHGQYWRKNNTLRDMIEFVLQYTLIYIEENWCKIRNQSTGMNTYQNQSKQFMKVRLSYYGTKKCETAELFLTINRTSQSVKINKGHAC